MRKRVSEVVVREAVRKYGQQLAEKREAVTSRANKLARFDPAQDVSEALRQLPSVEESRRRFEQELRGKLREVDAEVLGVPEVSQEDVLDRILKMRRPATATDDAYRDILVWESVLESLRDSAAGEDAVLVSGDKNAYAEEERLAGDLVDDLREAGIDPDHVEWYSSLEELLAARESLRTDVQSRLMETMEREEPVRTGLVEAIRHELLGARRVSGVAVHGEVVDEAQVLSVDEVRDIEVYDAAVLEGSLATVSLLAVAECDVLLTIFAPSPWISERYAGSIDGEFGPYMEMETLELRVEATLDWDQRTETWGSFRQFDLEARAGGAIDGPPLRRP